MSPRLAGYLVAASAVFLLSATPLAQAASYHLIDLGEGEAVGIDHAGTVAGNSYPEAQPMRWRGDTPHWLKPFGDGFAAGARAMDFQGDVAGYIMTPGGLAEPVVWRRGTSRYELLPLPAGAADGVATAITSRGRAAGNSSSSAGSCLVWDAKHAVTDVGVPPDMNACVATGMNEAGEVAVVGIAIGIDLPYVWRGGSFHALGVPDAGMGYALAINRFGHVAGSTVDAKMNERAVIWKSNTPTDLGAPDGSWSLLAAWALNSHGDAAGGGTQGGIDHALLFKDGRAIVLDSVVDDLADWHLVVAKGINDDGTIVGWGTRRDAAQYVHAFMLVPSGSD
jgi:probable HAF family extracellular repeat protein